MDDFEKYLNKALRFLSFRPRSEKEMRDNLIRKKAPPEIIERIIASFKEQKFINDEEFAKWFIDQRLRFRPKGIRIIRLELRQKGISQEVIEDVISNLPIGDDSSPIDNDLESAKKLVEKKLPRYNGLERRVIYNKLGAFLARRGFGWDTIKKSIDEGLDEGV